MFTSEGVNNIHSVHLRLRNSQTLIITEKPSEKKPRSHKTLLWHKRTAGKIKGVTTVLDPSATDLLTENTQTAKFTWRRLYLLIHLHMIKEILCYYQNK